MEQGHTSGGPPDERAPTLLLFDETGKLVHVLTDWTTVRKKSAEIDSSLKRIFTGSGHRLVWVPKSDTTPRSMQSKIRKMTFRISIGET